MKWPDTIGFDSFGNIVFTSNQLYNFNNNMINFDDFNEIKYRIYTYFVGTKSYLNYFDDKEKIYEIFIWNLKWIRIW